MFKFDSKLEPGQDFLDRLSALYGDFNTSAETLNLVDETWQSWERRGTKRPFNFEDVAVDPFGVYRGYYADIISGCKIKHIDLDSIFFTLLPTKSLNSHAHTTANKDKVIVFDSELIPLFTAFIISSLVNVYTGTSDFEKEEIDTFIFKLLDDYLNRTLYRTDEINSEFVNLFSKIIRRDYQITELGCYFSMAFTVFILCHELSHHILGHSQEKRMNAFGASMAVEVPIDKPSYNEEYEADALGYELFLTLIKNNNRAKMAIIHEAFNHAPLIFLGIFDILESYVELKLGVKPKSDTHPPPEDRKKRLIKEYASKLNSDGIELYEGFEGYSKHLKEKLTNTSFN